MSACERQSRFGDLEGSLHWEVGAFELTAQTGHRFGDSYDVTADSRRWTSATATMWLSDRIAIVGGGGRQPALPLRGIPARSFGMAGLELAYWPFSKTSVPVSLPRAVLVKASRCVPRLPACTRSSFACAALRLSTSWATSATGVLSCSSDAAEICGSCRCRCRPGCTRSTSVSTAAPGWPLRNAYDARRLRRRGRPDQR